MIYNDGIHHSQAFPRDHLAHVREPAHPKFIPYLGVIGIRMPVLIWTSFVVFILAMVLLDLGVFHRKSRVISRREALVGTLAWVGLALVFNGLVYFLYEENWFGWSEVESHRLTGREAAIQFFTSFLVAKSLSVDSVLAIAMIFTSFRVPRVEQHRVLFWGIWGALALRGAMIAAGTVLISQMAWVACFFGVVLIASAVKMLSTRHEHLEPERKLPIRLVRRFCPVSDRFDESRFLVTAPDGRTVLTPLMLTLVAVESRDALSAVDSVLAVFAVTRDPFLVFTSSVFGLLGLRYLYFALAGVMEKFRYLRMGLVLLLVFMSAKLILADHLPIPDVVSLAVVASILSIGVVVSLWTPARHTGKPVPPLVDDVEALANTAYRHARRVVILVLGSTVLLAGVAMLVLPGPAIVVIPVGLAILGIEFAWARRWLRKIGKTVKNVQGKLMNPRNHE